MVPPFSTRPATRPGVLVAPGARLLELGRERDNSRFVVLTTHDLESDRHSRLGKSVGQRERRLTCRIEGEGKHQPFAKNRPSPWQSSEGIVPSRIAGRVRVGVIKAS